METSVSSKTSSATHKAESKSSWRAAPLDAWQRRAVHTVTGFSGQRLKIRIPGIATLLEHGDLPEDLVALAVAELTDVAGAASWVAQPEDMNEKMGRIEAFGRFQRHLVCSAIVAVETEEGWQDVELSLDDLEMLPEDDLAMVAEIVQRLRGQDARGVRIGVEPLDRWATFRKAHACPDEGCEGCAKLQDEFSTADLGAL